jgi:hypothetical protein
MSFPALTAQGNPAPPGRTMTLFEFVFGLQAIILGLALTHMATAVNRLVLARERVKWDARPLLAAVLMLLAILLYWLQSWNFRDMRETTIGETIVKVMVNLVVYAAAAAILPEEVPAKGRLDLGAHYDKVRVYFLALFIAPILVMSTLRPAIQVWLGQRETFGNWDNVILIAAAGVCMAVKNRWVNLVVLAGLALWMLSAISGYALAPTGVRH